MTDYDELSYLRKLAREQDEAIRHYKNFVDNMDKVGVMLIDPLKKGMLSYNIYCNQKES